MSAAHLLSDDVKYFSLGSFYIRVRDPSLRKTPSKRAPWNHLLAGKKMDKLIHWIPLLQEDMRRFSSGRNANLCFVLRVWRFRKWIDQFARTRAPSKCLKVDSWIEEIDRRSYRIEKLILQFSQRQSPSLASTFSVDQRRYDLNHGHCENKWAYFRDAFIKVPPLGRARSFNPHAISQRAGIWMGQLWTALSALEITLSDQISRSSFWGIFADEFIHVRFDYSWTIEVFLDRTVRRSRTLATAFISPKSDHCWG